MTFSTSKANWRSVDFQMYLLVKFQRDQQVSVNLREINNEPGSLRTGNQLRLGRRMDWGFFYLRKSGFRLCKNRESNSILWAESSHDSYLTYSLVLLMICKVRGLMPVGNFSSAKLRGISSPVSRFFIITLARISYWKNKMWNEENLIRLENLEQNRNHQNLQITYLNGKFCSSLSIYFTKAKLKLAC